jgi:uncharacterized repeat protein (TIGR03803 family)
VLLLGLLLTATAATAQTYSVLHSFGVLTNVTGWNPRAPLVQGPDGTLYGTASMGEGIGGTVFKINSDGMGFTVLKWFTNSVEGSQPYAGLVLSGSTLYGTTYYGGSSDNGTVFKVNTDGTGYTVLKNFTGSDGASPYAGLVLFGATLYGTTENGGSFGNGTVFKVNTDGTGYTVFESFPPESYDAYTGLLTNSDGAFPDAGLTLSGSTLYGAATSGGNFGVGTIFQVNTDGTGFTVLKTLDDIDAGEGALPYAALTLSGSTLYGTTQAGGTLGYGTVFAMNTDGTGYTVLHNFLSYFGGGGTFPYGSLTLSGSKLYGTTYATLPPGYSSNYGTVFRLNTDGTGYLVLKTFDYSDGATTYAGLTLSGSTLYGTTYLDGGPGKGTVFRIETDGTGYTVLKTFAPYSDAADPLGLTLSGNALYGTTQGGGSSGAGTVFKMNTDGTGYTLLWSFGAGSDGASPQDRVTLLGSALYGTTYSGGSSGQGTVFKLNTDGTGYTVLTSFTNSSNDGGHPQAGVTLSGSVLYGTTGYGGTAYAGTVFRMNNDGTGYVVLHNFAGGSEGEHPYADLTLSGSVLYGTTPNGGSSNVGTVFKLNTDGTGYTVLKNFAYTDGASPYAGLTLSGNALYGTTYSGGSSNNGTVFKLNTDGTGYTVLKNFTGSDGAFPHADLTLFGTTLYGTTQGGGTANAGTVFRVNTDGSSYTVLKNFSGGDGSGPYASPAFSGSTLYGTTSHGGNVGEGIVFKLDLSPPLTIQSLGNAVVLNWTDSSFALQAAPAVSGVYTNIPGATSPYTNSLAGHQKFFRLLGN